MCHKSKIVKNGYSLLDYGNIGHGAYLLSSNACSWSNINKEKNNLLVAFKFVKDDTVICTYDPD
jgi:hypothetical protein